MTDFIAISTLNDFIFCPYSIYLHNVYMGTDDEVYKAVPQIQGSLAHQGIDKKSGTTSKSDIMSMPVYSESLGLFGKIDIYKEDKHLLVERKYNLKNIYIGQIYQLWAQCFCLMEMGYKVDSIAFYEISTNKMTYLDMPGASQRAELEEFISKFRSYRPDEDSFRGNPNKCKHCIYCNLCDKSFQDNVYA